MQVCQCPVPTSHLNSLGTSPSNRGVWQAFGPASLSVLAATAGHSTALVLYPEGCLANQATPAPPALSVGPTNVARMTDHTNQPDPGDAPDQDKVTSPDTIGAAKPSGSGNLQKDPSDWVSGDDPMTEAQRSYLDTLARQHGEELPADLNKAQASEHIDRLRSSSSDS